jgi:hypothetical protein
MINDERGRRRKAEFGKWRCVFSGDWHKFFCDEGSALFRRESWRADRSIKTGFLARGLSSNFPPARWVSLHAPRLGTGAKRRMCVRGEFELSKSAGRRRLRGAIAGCVTGAILRARAAAECPTGSLDSARAILPNEWPNFGWRFLVWIGSLGARCARPQPPGQLIT